MVDATSTLLVSASSKLVSAGAFAFVAYRLASRSVSPAARAANFGFAAFWASLGVWSAMSGALDAIAASGSPSLALSLVGRYASLLLLCGGFAGFLHYMGYVYAGERWKPWPLYFAYALLFLLLAAYVAVSRPIGVSVLAWRTDLAYVVKPQGPLFVLSVLLLLVPPLAASIAYARLRSRLDARDQRRRSLVVGASLATWFAAMLVATLSNDDLAYFVSRSLAGALVAVLVALAHSPPALVAKSARSTTLDLRMTDLV